MASFTRAQHHSSVSHSHGPSGSSAGLHLHQSSSNVQASDDGGSDSEDWDCPLCMEEMDIDDRGFFPCECDYQICRFCYHRITQDYNGRCPACRRVYTEDQVRWNPISPEKIAKIKAQKRAKEREKREIESDASKQLANVRVVQKNLVYVIGLPAHIATEEVLRSHDYFGQFGKINKIVINRRQHQGGQLSIAVYVTYARKEDATQAIEAVDGSTLDGRTLRATYGTTKYCSFYLRGITCQNPNCMYLHEPGEEADSYNKEDLASSRPHFHSQDGHGDHHRHHGGDGHNQHHRDSTSFPHIGNGRVQVVPAGTLNPHHHHPQQQRAASPAVGRNSAVSPAPRHGVRSRGPSELHASRPLSSGSINASDGASALPATASWASKPLAQTKRAPQSTAATKGKAAATPKYQQSSTQPRERSTTTSWPVGTIRVGSAGGNRASSPSVSASSSTYPTLTQMTKERKEQIRSQHKQGEGASDSVISHVEYPPLSTRAISPLSRNIPLKAHSKPNDIHAAAAAPSQATSILAKSAEVGAQSTRPKDAGKGEGGVGSVKLQDAGSGMASVPAQAGTSLAAASEPAGAVVTKTGPPASTPASDDAASAAPAASLATTTTTTTITSITATMRESSQQLPVTGIHISRSQSFQKVADSIFESLNAKVGLTPGLPAELALKGMSSIASPAALQSKGSQFGLPAHNLPPLSFDPIDDPLPLGSSYSPSPATATFGPYSGPPSRLSTNPNTPSAMQSQFGSSVLSALPPPPGLGSTVMNRSRTIPENDSMWQVQPQQLSEGSSVSLAPGQSMVGSLGGRSISSSQRQRSRWDFVRPQNATEHVSIAGGPRGVGAAAPLNLLNDLSSRTSALPPPHPLLKQSNIDAVWNDPLITRSLARPFDHGLRRSSGVASPAAPPPGLDFMRSSNSSTPTATGGAFSAYSSTASGELSDLAKLNQSSIDGIALSASTMAGMASAAPTQSLLQRIASPAHNCDGQPVHAGFGDVSQTSVLAAGSKPGYKGSGLLGQLEHSAGMYGINQQQQQQQQQEAMRPRRGVPQAAAAATSSLYSDPAILSTTQLGQHRHSLAHASSVVADATSAFGTSATPSVTHTHSQLSSLLSRLQLGGNAALNKIPVPSAASVTGMMPPASGSGALGGSNVPFVDPAIMQMGRSLPGSLAAAPRSSGGISGSTPPAHSEGKGSHLLAQLFQGQKQPQQPQIQEAQDRGSFLYHSAATIEPSGLSSHNGGSAEPTKTHQTVSKADERTGNILQGVLSEQVEPKSALPSSSSIGEPRAKTSGLPPTLPTTGLLGELFSQSRDGKLKPATSHTDSFDSSGKSQPEYKGQQQVADDIGKKIDEAIASIKKPSFIFPAFPDSLAYFPTELEGVMDEDNRVMLNPLLKQLPPPPPSPPPVISKDVVDSNRTLELVAQLEKHIEEARSQAEMVEGKLAEVLRKNRQQWPSEPTPVAGAKKPQPQQQMIKGQK